MKFRVTPLFPPQCTVKSDGSRRIKLRNRKHLRKITPLSADTPGTIYQPAGWPATRDRTITPLTPVGQEGRLQQQSPRQGQEGWPLTPPTGGRQGGLGQQQEQSPPFHGFGEQPQGVARRLVFDEDQDQDAPVEAPVQEAAAEAPAPRRGNRTRRQPTRYGDYEMDFSLV